MRFLALKSDCLLPSRFRDTHVAKLKVRCYKCKAMKDHLYAPFAETEAGDVRPEGMWLDAWPPRLCPDADAEWFLTPDRRI
jgi:hypothetical protein